MGRSRNSRGGYERHVRLPHLLTGSAAWRDLSGNAIKVYIALARFNLGDNNGNLFFSVETGMKETGLARNTVSRGLRDLEEHGLIAAVERGYFQVKGGPATRWRLTHIPAPSCKPSLPTHDYHRWHPVEKGNKLRSQNLTPTVSKIETTLETFPSAVSNIETAPVETPLVSVDPSISKIDTQLVYHGQGAFQGVSDAGKQAETAGGPSPKSVDPGLLEELRQRTRTYLDGAGLGAQSRLALAARISGGTLSKFLDGRRLSRTHFIALQLAIPDGKHRRAA